MQRVVDPGHIVEFTSAGRLLWRMGGFNQPSLALPLPNGDILLNDDYNHRVCVVDPATDRIVWQYGHTGKSGSAPALPRTCESWRIAVVRRGNGAFHSRGRSWQARGSTKTGASLR